MLLLLSFERDNSILLVILAGDIYAKCMICVTDISVSHGGRNDIMKHIKGKHHQEMVKSATSTRPLASFYKPQVS